MKIAALADATLTITSVIPASALTRTGSRICDSNSQMGTTIAISGTGYGYLYHSPTGVQEDSESFTLGNYVETRIMMANHLGSTHNYIWYSNNTIGNASSACYY